MSEANITKQKQKEKKATFEGLRIEAKLANPQNCQLPVINAYYTDCQSVFQDQRAIQRN